MDTTDTPDERGHWTGAKYDRNLDVAEIAKRLRAEIKAAVQGGELPAAKYRVRISRFSGGRSLSIKAYVGFKAKVIDQDEVALNRQSGQSCPWLTRDACRVHETLSRLMNAYNFDKSDIMTDYFHVNFYGDVQVYGTDDAG